MFFSFSYIFICLTMEMVTKKVRKAFVRLLFFFLILSEIAVWHKIVNMSSCQNVFPSSYTFQSFSLSCENIQYQAMAHPVWCCWPGHWRLHWLSVPLSHSLVNLPGRGTQLEEPICVRLPLTVFLVFLCKHTPERVEQRSLCSLSPSLEFCGLPDQAKEHTWGWMGMWGSAGVRKWKGNGKGKQTQDENFCISNYIPSVGLPQFSPIYTHESLENIFKIHIIFSKEI